MITSLGCPKQFSIHPFSPAHPVSRLRVSHCNSYLAAVSGLSVNLYTNGLVRFQVGGLLRDPDTTHFGEHVDCAWAPWGGGGRYLFVTTRPGKFVCVYVVEHEKTRRRRLATMDTSSSTSSTSEEEMEGGPDQVHGVSIGLNTELRRIRDRTTTLVFESVLSLPVSCSTIDCGRHRLVLGGSDEPVLVLINSRDLRFVTHLIRLDQLTYSPRSPQHPLTGGVGSLSLCEASGMVAVVLANKGSCFLLPWHLPNTTTGEIITGSVCTGFKLHNKSSLSPTLDDQTSTSGHGTSLVVSDWPSLSSPSISSLSVSLPPSPTLPSPTATATAAVVSSSPTTTSCSGLSWPTFVRPLTTQQPPADHLQPAHGILASDAGVRVVGWNRSHGLLALGCVNGRIQLLRSDRGLRVAHNVNIAESLGLAPGRVSEFGPVEVLEWSRDGLALLAAWGSFGLAIVSYAGRLLFSPFVTPDSPGSSSSYHSLPTVHRGTSSSPDHKRELNTDTLRRSPPVSAVRAVCWGSYDLAVFAVYRSAIVQLTEFTIYRSASLGVWPYRLDGAGSRAASDNARRVLIGADRFLVAEGAPWAPFTVSWTHVPLPPPAYLGSNWPMREAALSPGGSELLCAGSRGIALFNMRLRRWRLFGNVMHERQLRTRNLPIGWFTPGVFYVCASSEEDGEVQEVADRHWANHRHSIRKYKNVGVTYSIIFLNSANKLDLDLAVCSLVGLEARPLRTCVLSCNDCLRRSVELPTRSEMVSGTPAFPMSSSKALSNGLTDNPPLSEPLLGVYDAAQLFTAYKLEGTRCVGLWDCDLTHFGWVEHPLEIRWGGCREQLIVLHHSGQVRAVRLTLGGEEQGLRRVHAVVSRTLVRGVYAIWSGPPGQLAEFCPLPSPPLDHSRRSIEKRASREQSSSITPLKPELFLRDVDYRRFDPSFTAHLRKLLRDAGPGAPMDTRAEVLLSMGEETMGVYIWCQNDEGLVLLAITAKPSTLQSVDIDGDRPASARSAPPRSQEQQAKDSSNRSWLGWLRDSSAERVNVSSDTRFSNREFTYRRILMLRIDQKPNPVHIISVLAEAGVVVGCSLLKIQDKSAIPSSAQLRLQCQPCFHLLIKKLLDISYYTLHGKHEGSASGHLAVPAVKYCRMAAEARVQVPAAGSLGGETSRSGLSGFLLAVYLCRRLEPSPFFRQCLELVIHEALEEAIPVYSAKLNGLLRLNTAPPSTVLPKRLPPLLPPQTTSHLANEVTTVRKSSSPGALQSVVISSALPFPVRGSCGEFYSPAFSPHSPIVTVNEQSANRSRSSAVPSEPPSPERTAVPPSPAHVLQLCCIEPTAFRTLSFSVDLLKCFESYLAEVLIAGIRKTEPLTTPILIFPLSGLHPHRLFLNCMSRGMLRTASLYLLVLQNLVGPLRVRNSYVILLIKQSLERNVPSLTKHLVHFFKALYVQPSHDGALESGGGTTVSSYPSVKSSETHIPAKCRLSVLESLFFPTTRHSVFPSSPSSITDASSGSRLATASRIWRPCCRSDPSLAPPVVAADSDGVDRVAAAKAYVELEQVITNVLVDCLARLQWLRLYYIVSVLKLDLAAWLEPCKATVQRLYVGFSFEGPTDPSVYVCDLNVDTAVSQSTSNEGSCADQSFDAQPRLTIDRVIASLMYQFQTVPCFFA